jgi:alpha-tubulin suppressor-like RCC1 family protein
MASDGTAVSWGNNNVGQLGRGDLIDQAAPSLINSSSLGSSLVASIQAAGVRSALLTSTGQIYVWVRR